MPAGQIRENGPEKDSGQAEADRHQTSDHKRYSKKVTFHSVTSSKNLPVT